MASPTADPANDDAPPPPSPARRVPVIGFVGAGGAVTITHPHLMPDHALVAGAFPNDPREA